MKSQLVYLRHILECIAWVEEYTAKGKEFFQSSHMAQDATLRQLQVMAEFHSTPFRRTQERSPGG